MNIYFRTSKLRKLCNEQRKGIKEWGAERAKKVRLRLAALDAAETLEDLRNAPGRLHELTGSRKGQLAFDLDGPYRLIMCPSETPLPVKEDGGLDLSRIQAVTIFAVEDYHG